jgi:predicted glycogen debranching enzyme
MINFNADQCADYDFSSSREWLETNGRGGFRFGDRERHEHAPLPTAYSLLLRRVKRSALCFCRASKKPSSLAIRASNLSTNRYAPGVTHPEGFRLQTNFRLDPHPVFTFRCGAVTLEKSVLMIYGENTTIIRYRLLESAGAQVRLDVRPLVALRTYHSVQKMNTPTPQVALTDSVVHVTSGDEAKWNLRLAHDAAGVNGESIWYERFEYDEEIRRGFNDAEDLFNPCRLSFELDENATRVIIASAADAPEHSSHEAAALVEDELKRRGNIAARASKAANDETRALVLASDAFLVQRHLHEGGAAAAAHPTVIAGYHWFTDWGRDAMIALPGLALSTDRLDDAEAIMTTFAAYMRDGLIPNYFPDAGGEPSYNTADATLWFAHVAGELMRRGRASFIRTHLYDNLRELVRAHISGTRYGIRVAPDGLLRIGEPGEQLTWMDAKIGDYVVTPRDGKPVEIQALWYNALRVIENMATEFNDDETRATCARFATAAEDSFALKFWNAEARCLHDVIRDDETADAAIRPNQIFAVSLPHAILRDTQRAREVVATVERELLTPYGLRSLAPSDPAYRPRYEGDVWSRDTAYHQGTVWAWLMGGFITAYLRVHDHSPESLRQARLWLAPLHEHLREAGLGQVRGDFRRRSAAHRARLHRASVEHRRTSALRIRRTRMKAAHNGSWQIRSVTVMMHRVNLNKS